MASVGGIGGCLTVTTPAYDPSGREEDTSDAWGTSESAFDATESPTPTSNASTSSNPCDPGQATGATTLPEGHDSTGAASTDATGDLSGSHTTSAATESTSITQTTPTSGETATTDTTTTDTTTTQTTPETHALVTNAQIAVETLSYAGHYAPDNIGALWIEREDGAFVDTLELWAKVRRKHLVAWKARTAANIGDAISGATAPGHTLHHIQWDLRDAQGQPVPAGNYRLRGEYSEDNSLEDDVADGPTFDLPFTLHYDQPQSFVGPATAHFARIEITFEAGL